jgi:hypothetical protein
MLFIQGEHKNTPWFQVVIKSKLTGIFCFLDRAFFNYEENNQQNALI